MSLMDNVLGALGGALGGQAGRQQGMDPMIQAVLGMLAGGGGAGGAGGGLGGLGGLLQAFQQHGLGDQVQSWVGTGQNLPISAEQLQKVLGGGALGGLARQLGLSTDDAASGLAGVLPGLIDSLTPQGKLPEGGLGDVASIMEMLGKR